MARQRTTALLCQNIQIIDPTRIDPTTGNNLETGRVYTSNQEFLYTRQQNERICYMIKGYNLMACFLDNDNGKSLTDLLRAHGAYNLDTTYFVNQNGKFSLLSMAETLLQQDGNEIPLQNYHKAKAALGKCTSLDDSDTDLSWTDRVARIQAERTRWQDTARGSADDQKSAER